MRVTLENLPRVLLALVKYSRPVGFGIMQYRPDFGLEDAKRIVGDAGPEVRRHFDYVNGCPIKVGWADGYLTHAGLYDRDNGPGRCELAVLDALTDPGA